MSISNSRQLSEEEWKHYEEEGYVVIRGFLEPEDLRALQQRIDDIMLGKAEAPYERMLMQLDSETGAYEDAGQQTKGHKGATLNYRKIQDLEYDPVFLQVMRHPLLEEACRRAYGNEANVGCFRAMFMNKPANRGTVLPFHQDRWNYLDRDPELTAWIALDPATIENGCVQVIPRTHRIGLVNPEHNSGFLTKEQAAEWVERGPVIHVELEAGDLALLHNRLIHGSDRNRSAQSRRAFSVCYMDAATRDLKQPEHTWPVVFGEGALSPG